MPLLDSPTREAGEHEDASALKKVHDDSCVALVVNCAAGDSGYEDAGSAARLCGLGE
jgi:hypothetical protein